MSLEGKGQKGKRKNEQEMMRRRSTISNSRLDWHGETAAVYTGVSLASPRGTGPAIEAGL
jgi:hypothetical protein